jgi:MinD superfamily P-loop ATPase
MIIAVLGVQGGTGKTLLSVNLAAVAKKSTYIDCDVEKPSGHLFFKPEQIKSSMVSVITPALDRTLCCGCRACVTFCSFDAVSYKNNEISFSNQACLSCGGCKYVCNKKAIFEKTRVIGEMHIGVSKNVKVLTGTLYNDEAFGISIIKKLLNEIWDEKELTIIDCPNGNSINVKEIIKKADYCILAAEPTRLGTYHLQAAYELVRSFGKRLGVVLNKCNTDENYAEKYCAETGIRILNQIPFDHELGTMHGDASIAAKENLKYREMFSSLLQMVTEELQP